MQNLSLAATLPQAAPDGGAMFDGIYFGLPFEDYLADPALGSTALRELRKNPTTYWHNSPMNPKRVVKKTSYLDRGTAMHTMLLEGEGAFTATYLRGAPRTDDMTPAEKGALTKAEKTRAAGLGMLALPAEDYDRILEVREVIKDNAEIAGCFVNGIHEVSVFWKRDGVRRKARLDYLKPNGVGDLKSVSNTYGRDFVECCRMAIRNWDYHLQAAHYIEARSKIRAYANAGLVHGPHDAALFKRIADNPGLGWQWVFVCAEGAPDTYSISLTTDNPILEDARIDLEIGVSRYVKYMRRFGTERWRLIRSVEELIWDDMPGYFARRTIEESAEYDEWMAEKESGRYQ
jgi:hypothetical protein